MDASVEAALRQQRCRLTDLSTLSDLLVFLGNLRGADLVSFFAGRHSSIPGAGSSSGRRWISRACRVLDVFRLNRLLHSAEARFKWNLPVGISGPIPGPSLADRKIVEEIAVCLL